MKKLPPLLAYIKKSEEAERLAQEAAQPLEAVPAIDPDLPPQGEQAVPMPADIVQPDNAGSGANEDAGPVDNEEGVPSLSLSFKTVDFQKGKHAKVSKPSVLRTVQALHLPDDGTKKPPICYCGTPRLGDVDVHLRESGTGKKKAGVSGVWRCRNGEICPLCAEAATARRRDAYARVGGAAIEKGGCIVTVVLSVSHSLQDRLADLLKAVKKASTGARAGGPWHRKIKVALGALGVLVDHHVRHGDRYGWHYHQHLTIFCLSRDEAAIKAAIAAMIERYVRLLAQQGFRADASQQHVKILKDHPEGNPYTYPADHNGNGDDENREIVAADHGEEESLSPLMLAERAANGDKQAAALFMEFSAAIKKTRSVVVTPTLAKSLNIEPKVDEVPVYDESTRLGSIPGRVWAKLLDENLATTFLTRVEAAGRENWPAIRWWALEQTGEAPEYSVELADEIAQLIHAQQRLTDPTAIELAENQIGILRLDWIESHGTDVVGVTIDYVAAHHRQMKVDAYWVQWWVETLEDQADKVNCHRACTSPMTLPSGYKLPFVVTTSGQGVPVG